MKHTMDVYIVISYIIYIVKNVCSHICDTFVHICQYMYVNTHLHTFLNANDI